MNNRLSQSKLEKLDSSLNEKDHELLAMLSECRYMMTSQIQRLFFKESPTHRAAMVATNRTMKRLKSEGLVASFERRIGGVRAGSASYVWHLTDGGIRLVNLNKDEDISRRRFLEPSYAFMQHTLSVAECYIRIKEICLNNSLAINKVEFEPDCWRQYVHYGKKVSLNPDLFIVTASNEYEDRWFIEVDLSTESPATVIFKCERYHEYFKSLSEQKKNLVFPITLWVVPDNKRKEKLKTKIKTEFKNKNKLFRVITMDELDDIIVNGCDPETLY